MIFLGDNSMYRISRIIKEIEDRESAKSTATTINYLKLEKFLLDTGYNEKITDDFLLKFRFCETINYQGRQVAESKIKYIDNIIKQAEKTKKITKIVLFGSTITARCTPISDIDIAIYGNIPPKRYLISEEYRRFVDAVLGFDIEQDYDMIYLCNNEENTGSIYDDIEQGLVIFSKEENSEL